MIMAYEKFAVLTIMTKGSCSIGMLILVAGSALTATGTAAYGIAAGCPAIIRFMVMDHIMLTVGMELTITVDTMAVIMADTVVDTVAGMEDITDNACHYHAFSHLRFGFRPKRN